MFFFHDAPGAGPVWTPGARLVGFIKRTTIRCYTQNMKALGHVVAEKKIFLCFPIVILRLHYVPGGHGGHVSDNLEQNGITVRQRRGTG